MPFSFAVANGERPRRLTPLDHPRRQTDGERKTPPDLPRCQTFAAFAVVRRHSPQTTQLAFAAHPIGGRGAERRTANLEDQDPPAEGTSPSGGGGHPHRARSPSGGEYLGSGAAAQTLRSAPSSVALKHPCPASVCGGGEHDPRPRDPPPHGAHPLPRPRPSAETLCRFRELPSARNPPGRPGCGVETPADLGWSRRGEDPQPSRYGPLGPHWDTWLTCHHQCPQPVQNRFLRSGRLYDAPGGGPPTPGVTAPASVHVGGLPPAPWVRGWARGRQAATAAVRRRQ